MNPLGMDMRRACLVVGLVAAGLLLFPVLSLGRGGPRNAVLIVSRSRDAKEEAVARSLAERVFHLIEKKGLSKDVSIVWYHFEKADEREHCRSTLKISAEELPCAAIVELNAGGIPCRVKTRFPRVVGTDALAESIVAVAGGRSERKVAAAPAPRATPGSSTRLPAPPSPAATPPPAEPPSPPEPPVASAKTLCAPAFVGFRPFLGALISREDSDAGRGCRITEIHPKGIAGRAGLQVGDVVRGFGDVQFKTSDDLFSAVRNIVDGQQIAIRVVRDGKEMTVSYTHRPPCDLRDFVIVEGVGIPGVVEIGQPYHFVVGRLGAADDSQPDGREGRWQRYAALGINVDVDASYTVVAVMFQWPFAGRTAGGLGTLGTKGDIVSVYGSECGGRTFEDGNRTLLYTPRGIAFLVDKDGDIVRTFAFPASKD